MSVSDRALVTNLKYDKSIQNHLRSIYTDTEWETLIKSQLDAGLPVFYGARYEGGNHNFVVDGYNKKCEFHINWGWGGRYDGWYTLNNLKPDATRHFNTNHNIIINIKPDAGGSGSNEFWLQNFTSSKNIIEQNELFTVTFHLRSFGFFQGGQFGVALVDNNDNIKEVIGGMNYNFEITLGYNTGSRTINCIVFEKVSTRQYSLRVVTKVQDGEWKIAKLSTDNVPTSINFTVNADKANGGGYGLSLMTFTASKTTVSQNETFNVSTSIVSLLTQWIKESNMPA